MNAVGFNNEKIIVKIIGIAFWKEVILFPKKVKLCCL
jgi:hypothetical protein